VRLGGTDLPGIQRHRECLVEADAREVGIAIAERGQSVALTQPCKRRCHVLERLQLVARGEEHLECLVRDALVVAVFAGVGGERREPQVTEVVSAVRLAARELLARPAHALGRKPLRDARAVLLQPGMQEGFGARQHRLDIPECIIEVEGNGAHVAQHPLKVTIQWRRSRSSSATRTIPRGHCGRGC